MRPVVVKVTSKNQITLPGALMRELGNPVHFKAYVQGSNQALFPAVLATFDDQAREAGVPPSVLKEAYALVSERQAAEGLPPAAEQDEAG